MSLACCQWEAANRQQRLLMRKGGANLYFTAIPASFASRMCGPLWTGNLWHRRLTTAS